MKPGLKIGLVAAALAVAALLLIQVAGAQQAAPAAQGDTEVIDSTVVQRGPLTVTVTGTGTVIPARQVNLLFEASAPVAEVLAEEGQPVLAGEILARLDTTDLLTALQDAQIGLQAQEVVYEGLITPARDVDIAAAQAAVNAALASAGAASQGATAEELEIARMQTELSRNQLWQQQLDRDRTMEIGQEFRGGETGAPSQEILMASGLESLETQIQINEANYASTANRGPDLAGLGSAQAQLTQAQVNLDRLLNGPENIELEQANIGLQQAAIAIEQAQLALDRAVLYAPFDGVIARNNLVVGEMPPQAQPALILMDTSGYYVDLAIDESDIANVSVGQAVALDLDALGGEPLSGTVTRVALTPTQQGQLVTYTVRVAVDGGSAMIRPGMTATATITVSDLDNVLVVPNRFIRLDRATQIAFITVERLDGRFEEVRVELGLRNDIESEVVSGLQEGETIVLIPRATFNPLGG